MGVFKVLQSHHWDISKQKNMEEQSQTLRPKTWFLVASLTCVEVLPRIEMDERRPKRSPSFAPRGPFPRIPPPFRTTRWSLLQGHAFEALTLKGLTLRRLHVEASVENRHERVGGHRL